MNGIQLKYQMKEATIDSREVAEMIGIRHWEVLRKIEGSKDRKGYVEILAYNQMVASDFFIESSYRDASGKLNTCYKITKMGCEFLANKLTGEKGVLFTAKYVQRFNNMEQHIKQEFSYSGKTENIESFEMQLLGVQYASQILRVDETSKILMLERAHKQHHVPTNHLPAYVDEEVTKPITTLLKEHGVKMRAAKANTKLIELGLLEIKERKGSKGQIKEFKSVTEKGLEYGKNLINPKIPRETQPRWYPSKFQQLLGLMGVSS